MPSDYEKMMENVKNRMKADEVKKQQQPPSRTKTWEEYEKVLNEKNRINPYYGGKKSKRCNTRLRKTKVRKTKKLRKTKKHNKK